jgi:glycopeptide antibiotics resistance protein
MTSPYEITALPVVVPLAVVAFAVLLGHLRRRHALSVLRAIVAAVMCVYGAGVVGNTVLPVTVGGTASDLPWWSHLNLVPLVGTEPRDMLQNVVVFVPLGLLLPLVSRARSLPSVLLAGFLLSLTMEALQFLNAVVADGGHIADVNDLLANTLGAVVGCGLFRLALRLPVLGGLARAATWPTGMGTAATR